MAENTPPSLCIHSMNAENVVLTASAIPTQYAVTDKSAGIDIRNHYAMHTGLVMVDVRALHCFEYIRDIKNENVEEIFQNILVC